MPRLPSGLCPCARAAQRSADPAPAARRQTSTCPWCLYSTTPVGGGLLRDVIARETPTLVRPDSERYAVPAVAGALAVALAWEACGRGDRDPVPGPAPALARPVGPVQKLRHDRQQPHTHKEHR